MVLNLARRAHRVVQEACEVVVGAPTATSGCWPRWRRSPEVRAWRQRLVERGKNKELADIAVARKLLHAIVAMRKHDGHWDATRFTPRLAEAASG